MRISNAPPKINGGAKRANAPQHWTVVMLGEAPQRNAKPRKQGDFRHPKMAYTREALGQAFNGLKGF